MRNPWLARNPFLSMWMSAGNQVLGATRGHLTNEVRRQQAMAVNDGTRALMAFWSGAAFLPKRGKRRLTKSR